MKFNTEDPILTTYALGELPDGEKKRALEKALEKDSALREEVAKIRAAAVSIEKAFDREGLPEMSQAERRALLEKAKHETAAGEPSKLVRFSRWASVAGGAIAACFVMMLAYRAYEPVGSAMNAPITEKFASAELEEIVDRGSSLGSPAAEERPAKIFSDEKKEATQVANKPSPSGSPLPQRIEPKKLQYKIQMQQDQEASATPKQQRIQVEAPESVVLPDLEVVIPQISAGVAVGSGSGGDSHRISGLGGGGLGNNVGVSFFGVKRSGTSASSFESDPYISYGQSVIGFLPDDEGRILPQVSRNREGYDTLVENPFRSPKESPLSTFSIDVDTASYANVRRFIEGGQLPPKDAVRIEEMVNYFPYDYAAPEKDAEHPFAVYVETAAAPWAPEHRLMKVGLKGYEVPWGERPAANLVFLVDVSGSMSHAKKLPLVKDALRMLVERLDERDRVAVVVYAGASGLALPSTTANNVETITHALENLKSGGSTNGGAGIELAYKVAREHFVEDGNNRVILCTDGDFNVGRTDRAGLLGMLENGAKDGIYLSILGFGMGNYQDGAMEELSNKGNGNYAYIDSQREARKVLVEQAAGTLLTIAKDVKMQVEFNPAEVAAYRLIGYANRMLAAEDFNNDKKDAGEIGAGHTVTALYEVIPVGVASEFTASVDSLKYQPEKNTAPEAEVSKSGEMATVKLRYKQPESDASTLMAVPVVDAEKAFGAASEDFRFASAVAGFGMLLREGDYRGNVSIKSLQDIVRGALGEDAGGYRVDFASLLNRVSALLESQREGRE